MTTTAPLPPRPSRRTRGHPPRVGLVLGGGGAVGAAYHAGALAALELDLGWDARTADVVVGTSAGALVGALVRVGVPSTDLAAMTVGAPALETDEQLLAAVAARPAFTPMSIRTLLRLPRVPHPETLLGLGRAWIGSRTRALPMLSLLLPDGREALAPHVALLDEQLGDGWPEDPLLVCTVRRRNCRRAVFGPGGRSARLSEAVTASCAVPGYFSEVVIGGEAYVDGGAMSATNADVLRRHDLDLAVILSPMTGASGRRSLSEAARRLCRRALDHEVAVLERVGIRTVVIEPTPEVLAHVPTDFMDESALDAIVREAFLATGRQIIESPALHELRSRPGVSSLPAGGRRAS